MVENAQIESTMLGMEDHGILTFFLSLKFEGSGQGFGGYAMDSYDKAKKRRVGSALGILEKHDLQPKGDYLDYYKAEDISDTIKSGQITEDDLRVLASGITSGRELFFVEEVEVD